MMLYACAKILAVFNLVILSSIAKLIVPPISLLRLQYITIAS